EWIPQNACPGSSAIHEGKDEGNRKSKIGLCICECQTHRRFCAKDPMTSACNGDDKQHSQANGSDHMRGLTAESWRARPNGDRRPGCKSVESEPGQNDDGAGIHPLQGKNSAQDRTPYEDRQTNPDQFLPIYQQNNCRPKKIEMLLHSQRPEHRGTVGHGEVEQGS